MDRSERLKSLFEPFGFGLEIGPSHNPLLPKSEGFQVETLDHMTQEQLKQKYSNIKNVDVSKIEYVDYVSDGSSMLNLINKKHCYNYIVASHVIEHITDPLRFFLDCEALLKEDGVLALAIPDKRFIFDVTRPLTTTGDILQAHLEKRSRHTPGAIFDEVAYNVLRNGCPGWHSGDSGSLSFASDLATAKKIFEDAQNTDHFHDIHAWQFTPSSFRLIINDLCEIKAISFQELQFYTAEGEFFISLSKNNQSPSQDRLELIKNIFLEQQVINI